MLLPSWSLEWDARSPVSQDTLFYNVCCAQPFEFKGWIFIPCVERVWAGKEGWSQPCKMRGFRSRFTRESHRKRISLTSPARRRGGFEALELNLKNTISAPNLLGRAFSKPPWSRTSMSMRTSTPQRVQFFCSERGGRSFSPPSHTSIRGTSGRTSAGAQVTLLGSCSPVEATQISGREGACLSKQARTWILEKCFSWAWAHSHSWLRSQGQHGNRKQEPTIMDMLSGSPRQGLALERQFSLSCAVACHLTRAHVSKGVDRRWRSQMRWCKITSDHESSRSDVEPFVGQTVYGSPVLEDRSRNWVWERKCEVFRMKQCSGGATKMWHAPGGSTKMWHAPGGSMKLAHKPGESMPS